MLARLKQIGWGALFGILISGQVLGQTATLLPNAKQQFFSDTGVPLASGTVDFYVPSTNTRKTTWNSSTESAGTQNPNPVVLDAAGRALIYGDGSYRQVVKDQNGNTIWDAVTASTGSGSGGTSPAWSEGVMVGTIIPWANTTLPAKYLYTAGQAISRTTYSQLFTALTYSVNILCVSGNATISVSTTISDAVPIGAPVEFSCFAPGTTVLAKSSGQLTLSTSATTTVSVSGTIFPWGNGDGTTTFNVPDLRGRVLAGRDNMNSSPVNRLTASIYGSNPDANNAVGGSQSAILSPGYLPPYVPSGPLSVTSTQTNVPSNASNYNAFAGAGTNHAVSGPTPGSTDATLSAITSTGTFTGYPYGGGVAVSATLATAGSGYSNGTQVLTLVGGTCSIQPQFSVTVTLGVPASPVLQTAGSCTSPPSNPSATSGGGGTGATLAVTYTALPFSLIQPTVTSDYIIKALPDDSPTGPGVTSLGGMTGAVACGTGIACNANTVSLAPGSNIIVNSMLAQMPAATIKMNNTASLANAADQTIQGLSSIAAPDASLDYLLIYDHSTGTLRRININQITVAVGSGVTSIGGASGALTVPTGGLAVTSGQLQNNVLASRAYALTQNLSAFSGIETLGYSTSGDGGGAHFVKVGSQPFCGPFNDTASFQDAGGNWWQISEPHGYKVKQFGAKYDWNQVALTGTDDTAAIQSAFDCAGVQNGPGVDVGGGAGRTVTEPAGFALVSNTITARNYVPMIGQGEVNTGWVMKSTFPTNQHFVILGDQFTQTSVFALQSVGAGGTPFTLNGGYSRSGNVYFLYALPICFYAAAANSGINFNITGTDRNGNAQTDTIAGPGAGSSSCSAKYWLSITRIDTNGATNGNVSAGVSAQATFVTRLQDMQLWTALDNAVQFSTTINLAAGPITGHSGNAMVYTNSAQHTGGLERVKIFAGNRSATLFETGVGGASTVTYNSVETFNHGNCAGCVSNNPQMYWNYAGLLVDMTNIVQAGAGVATTGAASVCAQLDGGYLNIKNYHCEGIATGIKASFANINNGSLTVMNANCGASMTTCIRIDAGVAANSTNVQGIFPNGATHTVDNNGVFTNTNITQWTSF